MHESMGKKAVLLICNIVLILGMVLATIIYSRTSIRQGGLLKRSAFCNTVESLRQVSQNYLSTEKGYVDDWVAYIEAENMTAEEALDYIRTTNTQSDRSAHLVNLTDMSARSTYLSNDNAWVHCYEDMEKLDTKASRAFLDKMAQMMDTDNEKLLVLGKYRVAESQRSVISVGKRVMIREDDGTDMPYLLLRLVPVEYMQRAWAFPTEYPDAEISLIVKDGGYVVQSPSLRAGSFLEFIRTYNFPDDYNRINEVAEQLSANDSGLFEYKDSKGQDCYYYYSRIGEDTDLCVLGYIPVDKIQTEGTDWTIVFIISGTILLLMLINGGYILSINRQLRKAIRMVERANEAKTQFLSSMSHDIRTPMNAVIGMTEIAKSHLDDPEYVKSCLDKVSLSGNHLLTLVNDILDISKVESGKMSLNPSVFSVRESVELMMEMVRQSADDKNIELTMKIDDAKNDIVVGDTLRLQQVMINLLTNAIKYTEPGGHVRFEISEHPAEKPEHVALQFVVADDGIGMSEEFQRTMYAAFSRATDSRINMIQGSGLGLAIAKQMVELMGGTIECSSAPGKGTTFTVHLELPVAEKKLVSEHDWQNEDMSGEFSGLKVLVAEDNDLNWEIIQVMLEEHGVICERAQNGQICLDLLKEHGAESYALILMDVQMPVMDGREAARQIRRSGDPAIRNIPIVAMTADAFAEDVYACLEAGMDGHISKPIDIKRVLTVLRKAQKGTLHKKED